MAAESFWVRAGGWINAREFRVLLGILAAYAVILFVVHGEVKPFCDNPGYTDPAVNFVTGHGFTSTCWYAQGSGEFWAGNVPLFEFLLVPWFKLLGVSHAALIAFNFLLVALASVLLWFALARGGLVKEAHWRLGAIALILSTDCSSYLLTFGRYDPLAFVLTAAAAACLAYPGSKVRFGGLCVVGFLVPWTSLAAVVFTAVLGGVLFLFYPKRFWKELVAFGVGGAIGAVVLVAFYHHLGIWDAFIKSIAPHMMGSANQETAAFQAHRRGGITQTFLLKWLALSMLIFGIRNVIKGYWKFPIYATVCCVLIPTVLYKTGVFSLHYGWMLLFVMIVFLFAMLSRENWSLSTSLKVVLGIVVVGVLVPGSVPRKAIKNRLLIRREGDPQKNIEQFTAKVFRPENVGWIAEEFYYSAKPHLKKLFTSPVVFSDFDGTISYPGREDDLNSVNICVWNKATEGWNLDRLKKLPGKWELSGETLHAWGEDFVVYRRMDSQTAR